MSDYEKHSRTLVREHLGRELVRRGAWQACVWIDRATPIQEEDPWPNVCVYTNTDRTSETFGDDAKKQELSLLVEVRARREPNGQNHGAAIDGMPEHPAQTGKASEILDTACAAIERIVFENFNNRTLLLEGQSLIFDLIAEVNTDLQRNSDGEVPHVMAQIEFKLIYTACFPPLPPETCPLELVLGEILHKTCDPEDPLNGKLAVGVVLNVPHPDV
jgi:hypothetical protein